MLARNAPMNGTASSRAGAARASVRRIWSGVRPRYAASASFKGRRGSAPLPRHRTEITAIPRLRASAAASTASRDLLAGRHRRDRIRHSGGGQALFGGAPEEGPQGAQLLLDGLGLVTGQRGDER